MSGTSLDGVDGVLASFPDASSTQSITTVASAYIPFPEALRAELMALQGPGENEIHREALAANALAHAYAECVSMLVNESAADVSRIRGVGVHGQTIRHRPECGYTRQTNNPALLAELCGIDVIADFRSRDIAAGGQGAPLVPAFHQGVFGNAHETRIVVNIGGISNISVLAPGRNVIGFDTGPGNVLMDAWVKKHLGKGFDAGGTWGASGRLLPGLLARLLDEPYLALPPPKSTGRDLFHEAWLNRQLLGFENAAPNDVQATLTQFTATTISEAIVSSAPDAAAVYVCGGGAYNAHLMEQLQHDMAARGSKARVLSTEALGISPNHVEALAFAWLAYRHVKGRPGNLASVTGAKGPRILGALYPA